MMITRLLLLATLTASAQRGLKDIPDPDPVKQEAAFNLPEGMQIELFADNLHIPTAVLPADGGAYVANSTKIIFLKDTDGDGKADHRRVVLSGFGTEDTHHLVHTFKQGPDGMLYFAQSIYIHSHLETPYGVRRLMGGGIWHFRPETQQAEILSKGLINPWGFVFDEHGQTFATDGTAAHAWGLAWFENKKREGRIHFKKHSIIPEDKSPGINGLTFSQAHSLVQGDFNGDGLTDFATGKRCFAHNGKAPGSDQAAVLYWFQLARDDKGARFNPHLIDSDTGAGTQLAAADLNKDGTTDLGVGNKKGVFVFTSSD